MTIQQLEEAVALHNKIKHIDIAIEKLKIEDDTILFFNQHRRDPIAEEITSLIDGVKAEMVRVGLERLEILKQDLLNIDIAELGSSVQGCDATAAKSEPQSPVPNP